ncbi:amidohydrolase family protein [Nibricoccus sp. IMCC34717]|uniref:amidohydrolase family protein n=1 Tax=Nibricoccus sp. IMCC34717 TaxID=3034021 RepID=UPI00384ECE61
MHLYPPEVAADPAGWGAARGEGHWVTLCARRRKSGKPVQGFPTVDQLLRDLDGAGIAQAVLLGWYWEKWETCQWQNRFYAECRRLHPDRIQFFATITAAAGREAVAEECAWLAEAGCTGLGELSPHTQAPGADWGFVWELAATRGWPVNLHVSDPLGKPYPGRVETPLGDFLSWATGHPATRFILAHWGGGLAGRPEALALPNLCFDTAASPLTTTPEARRGMLAKAGSERVLFGSDYPLDLYPEIGYADFGLKRVVAEVGLGLGLG